MSLYYDYGTFIWILAVNTAIAAVYVLANLFRRKESRRGFLLKGLVMLLFPAVGPLYIFFSWVFLATAFHRPVDLEDVIFSKDRESILINAEEEKERNLVPIEDALIINDKSDARALFLDVIKRDPKKSLYSISLALDSEDSELSHYAAAVIQSELDKARKLIQESSERLFTFEKDLAEHEGDGSVLRTQAGSRFIQEHLIERSEEGDESWGEGRVMKGYYADIAGNLEASKDYSRHKEQAELQARIAMDAEIVVKKTLLDELTEEIASAHTLIGEIDQLLGQELLTDFESKRYTQIMCRAAELIEKRDVLSEGELNMLVIRNIKAGDLKAAENWGDKVFFYYPQSLEAHASRVKIAYAKGDREGFFKAVDEMKRSGLPLDREMLDVVRFFQSSRA